MTEEEEQAIKERAVEWLIHQGLGDETFRRLKRDGSLAADDLNKLLNFLRDQENVDREIAVSFTREELETAFKKLPDVQ